MKDTKTLMVRARGTKWWAGDLVEVARVPDLSAIHRGSQILTRGVDWPNAAEGHVVKAWAGGDASIEVDNGNGPRLFVSPLDVVGVL